MGDVRTDKHQPGGGERVRHVQEDLREEELGPVGVGAEIPLAFLRQGLLQTVGDAVRAEHPIAEELVLLGHPEEDEYLQLVQGGGRVPTPVRGLCPHHGGQRLERHQVPHGPVGVAGPGSIVVAVGAVQEAVLHAGVEGQDVPLRVGVDHAHRPHCLDEVDVVLLARGDPKVEVKVEVALLHLHARREKVGVTRDELVDAKSDPFLWVQSGGGGGGGGSGGGGVWGGGCGHSGVLLYCASVG